MRKLLVALVVVIGIIVARLPAEERPPLSHALPPAPAPSDAVVLFDGTDTAAWQKVKSDEPCPWELRDGGLWCKPGSGGIETKQHFGDCQVHLQFAVPAMPEATGQGKGNSGVYLQGRYEVQILDSFGLESKHDDCGAIYEIAGPMVNACLPAEQWQTYDILFRAARFGADGKLAAPPRMSVIHNGVWIHSNVEVPRTTRAAPYSEMVAEGPLYLQDHGNTVRFRNVWIRPLERP